MRYELDAATPNPVESHVGSRIRMRRKILGVSQEKLAESLGLTFQQVQKYERGANRVSASKLYQIAKALEAPILYFFEGLPDPTSDKHSAIDLGVDRIVSALLMTPEGLELATLFPRIDEASVRRRLLELVRALANESKAPDGDGG